MVNFNGSILKQSSAPIYIMYALFWNTKYDLYFIFHVDRWDQSYKKLKFTHISYNFMSMLGEGGAQVLHHTAGHDL